MYQSRDWNWLCEKRTEFRKADITIERLYQDVKRAHQFLYIVNDALQKCEGLGSPFAGKGHDIALFFQAYDDVTSCIGFADKGIYLLDSQFIYKRYCYFRGKNPIFTNDDIYGGRWDKYSYYDSLFQLGIIKRYGKSKEPLCQVSFSENDSKECFCIPNEIVDFDTRKMRVH